MSDLVLFLVIFILAGAGLLAANLVLGWLVRPDKPSPEKAEVYECGEQAIGTAWVQFDLRFYVVALLFVIFDVELAFFFPWAVVFGSATRAADESKPAAVRVEAAAEIQPTRPADQFPVGGPAPTPEEIERAKLSRASAPPPDPAAARELAWIAFADIMVFFAVLLVGFAYLWRRGDLAWVRSTAAQHPTADQRPPVATGRPGG
jgi:NADH-quinone oxidoreductase subunit A